MIAKEAFVPDLDESRRTSGGEVRQRSACSDEETDRETWKERRASWNQRSRAVRTNAEGEAKWAVHIHYCICVLEKSIWLRWR